MSGTSVMNGKTLSIANINLIIVSWFFSIEGEVGEVWGEIVGGTRIWVSSRVSSNLRSSVVSHHLVASGALIGMIILMITVKSIVSHLVAYLTCGTRVNGRRRSKNTMTMTSASSATTIATTTLGNIVRAISTTTFVGVRGSSVDSVNWRSSNVCERMELSETLFMCEQMTIKLIKTHRSSKHLNRCNHWLIIGT